MQKNILDSIADDFRSGNSGHTLDLLEIIGNQERTIERLIGLLQTTPGVDVAAIETIIGAHTNFLPSSRRPIGEAPDSPGSAG